MSADDSAPASAKAKEEEAGANVCPGLTSFWQWFIARLGYSWAPLKLPHHPHRNPSSPPARLAFAERIPLRLYVVGGALAACHGALLLQPIAAAQEEPSAQPLGETMHSCPRCAYLNL